MQRLGVNAGLLGQRGKAHRRIDEVAQNLPAQRALARQQSIDGVAQQATPNGAQLLMAQGDSSGLMNGPPAPQNFSSVYLTRNSPKVIFYLLPWSSLCSTEVTRVSSAVFILNLAKHRNLYRN